jgi:hypothetical protein
MEALQKFIDKHFDKYHLNARVKAALLLIYPLIISILVWYPEVRSSYAAIFGGLVTYGVLAFLANVLASLGRRKEPGLYHEWGGSPTTLFLRHRDQNLDQYTKLRYHQWINKNVPGLKMPTPEEEQVSPQDADQRYESAARFLRDKTRNEKSYPLVTKENINYGFSRNIWAVKSFGITLSLLTLLANSVFLYLKSIEVSNSELKHILEQISFLGLSIVWLISLLVVLAWIFWVRKAWVKTQGYAYARALLESCEKPPRARPRKTQSPSN